MISFLAAITFARQTTGRCWRTSSLERSRPIRVALAVAE